MPATIRFKTAPCALGHVLVAAGERGICQLRLGDDPAALVRGLRAALPGAMPAAPGDPVEAWCRDVARRIDAWGGNGAPPDLPLELRGTPFQLRVWEALRRIPTGETRTYGEIAREIGRPAAVRAVASACARNPVALLVPCHRVLPASGGAGGYRWGRARKETLLAQEGARPSARDTAHGGTRPGASAHGRDDFPTPP